MPVEVKVPSFGDSIVEVVISQWFKKVGDTIAPDDDLVEVESEKSTLPIVATHGGVLQEILAQPGETVAVGSVVARLADAGTAVAPAAPAAATPATATNGTLAPSPSSGGETIVMPAAARALADKGLSASDVTASGPGGRLLKEDVLKHSSAPAPTAAPAAQPAPAKPAPAAVSTVISTPAPAGERVIRRQPLTTIRKRIAQRLVEAQHNAALLTTFNEIDMSAAMALRKEYQDKFVEKYGIKLGFMSFFVKATINALLAYPAINAEIQGGDVVMHDYVDMGIAVGGGKGLVVPVIRSAEKLSFAEIEMSINKLAKRAMENSLKPQDLEGGTFTISNGGVYGSLLSTPIVNPPQSGVLGMHSIQDRAMVVNGQIVARPMMYVALTYDHRIVDGKEAVSFLKRIKECVESPLRLMLEV
ncbi:MAG: dihydrolipoyllysine-residue succinyltransferase [Planctomyces sp.]|nr:dihydrolipoyllysine-residue succinyltransferase [Planctomyces sp.]